MLPNLIIIGAGKAGTTSLHSYLAEHPEVFMSEPKELRLFRMDDWRERLDWYESHFETDARVRGESSPAYSMYPYRASASERIAELIPKGKLIYLVRDPVERAVANFVEFSALDEERRPVGVALTDFDDEANPYLAASRYSMQLDRYRAMFPAEQILVVDHAELLGDRAATLRRVFEFLDVDPDFRSEGFDRVHNERSSKMRQARIVYRLARRGAITPAQVQRGRIVGPIARLLERPIDSELSGEERAGLVNHLAPDVERLRAETGQAFASWPNFPPT